MSLHDRLTSLIEPIVTDLGLELFDLHYTGGTLSVLVQKPADQREPGAGSGVDVGAITAVSRAVSRVLDEADPISATYSLEVSTPGLERPLRTPAHFAGAVDEIISVKTTPDFDGPRRVKGTLVTVGDDAITVQTDGESGAPITIPLAAIDKARTVFEWGPEPKPGTAKPGAAKPGADKSRAAKPGAATSRAAKPGAATARTATSATSPGSAGKAGRAEANDATAPENASPSTGPAPSRQPAEPWSKEVTSS